MPNDWTDPNDKYGRTPNERSEPHGRTPDDTASQAPATIDKEVARLLRALGIYSCACATSATITAAARARSPEAFEAMLVALEEISPLWDDLVAQRGTRYTGTLLDELAWWIKHRSCRHGTPDEVGQHMGVVAVLELGADLAKRIRL